MDYDNFRQMVLGANLKNIKKGEVSNITTSFGQRGHAQKLNNHAALSSIMSKGYDEVELPDAELLSRVIAQEAVESGAARHA